MRSGIGSGKGDGIVMRVARWLALTACLAPAWPHSASAANPDFAGKTVTALVGFSAGGPVDNFARLVAAHLGGHIPGNPTVIVRNLPGATSLIMTNQLYNGAKRDGTVIGMPTSNIPLEQRLKLISPDGANVKFDITRFGWIGTPVREPQITWVWHTAPAQSLDDLRTNVIRMGGITSSADNYLLPTIVNQLLGTRMQTVTGYIGQNEIFLAAERGEVQGNNTGLSNITVNKADWLRDGKVRILLQYGTERLGDLPDVPTAAESGLPGFEAMLHYGLLAPAGTPKSIVARLNAELRKLINSPDVKERIFADGGDPYESTPEEYAADIDREEAKWSALIKKLGLRVE